jgi:hypothetical protein
VQPEDPHTPGNRTEPGGGRAEELEDARPACGEHGVERADDEEERRPEEHGDDEEDDAEGAVSGTHELEGNERGDDEGEVAGDGDDDAA